MNTDVFEADYQESWMTRQRCKSLLDIAASRLYGRCIEVGSGIGMFLEGLASKVDSIVGVDLDSSAVEKSRGRCADLANVDVIQVDGASLLYWVPGRFDCGFLFHVLEHVEDPGPLLKGIRNVIKPGGLFMAAVPNANSVHRIAGVEMGIISQPNVLGPADKKMGHVGVYYLEEFKDLISGYFEVHEVLGTYYKLFPNAMTETLLEAHQDAVEAAMAVAPYPEHAAEIVVVGRKREEKA